MTHQSWRTIQARRAQERGTLYGHGRRRVALVYPSAYAVGMSSLGFQTVYRLLNELPDTVAERAFLPDDEARPRDAAGSAPLLTYESGRPASDFPVVAFSVAYELEIAGVLSCLKQMGVPALAQGRGRGQPWVVVGGPLTMVNAAPLAPFADVICMGEAEELLAPLLDTLFAPLSRVEALRRLAALPGFYVPQLHGGDIPAPVHCGRAALPARSVIMTPQAELADMFLVETERGCARQCTFCVMQRNSRAGAGGMRLVDAATVLEHVPAAARRVGLVGAGVSDHPHIGAIVEALVAQGREVGLSSLRADRLSPQLVELLVRGGYRTLTTAADGASQRLRHLLHKGIEEKHLCQAVVLARAAQLKCLKVYAMLGVPEETEADLEELVALLRHMAQLGAPKTRLVLSLSAFVPKPHTPLAAAPFAGVREVERRMELVRRALQPTVEVRPASARWAWVEYQLAHGGLETGLQARQAWQAGGNFAAWRRALGGSTL